MQTPENPWRVSAPTLHLGKYQSIIIDRGELKKAVAGSNNHYLFSETGVGVQSVVIVGTPLQVTEFLLNNQTRGFESQIKSLQEIYMGISPYTPKTRFSGVFPLNELLASVAGFLTNLLPTPNWATLIGAPDQLKSLKSAINKLSDKDKAKGQLLYVKFSYLPEDKMQSIGKGKISFLNVLHAFQKHYKKP
ncbi:hypothetical protein [Pseudomonas sp. NA-150]|uniref:hypothetical protein n=1 Tax=Pseudomonas sp. NA-150 TaxID=3367525 RepID=UPI0037C96736